MKLIEEKTGAQEKLATYLQSKDSDLNQEQADILATTVIKFMEEAGRMGIQWGALKGVNKIMKGKRSKELYSKVLKGGCVSVHTGVKQFKTIKNTCNAHQSTYKNVPFY